MVHFLPRSLCAVKVSCTIKRHNAPPLTVSVVVVEFCKEPDAAVPITGMV